MGVQGFKDPRITMSKTSDALEAAVASILSRQVAEGQPKTARQRAEDDRTFSYILKLIAPRIRHFIRQYGLVAHWEDAEQACSIAVHRAIQAYDPEKAQFTTFVNWQIRGELQSLRFRLMTDQRPSARKVEATTVSLDAFSINEDGEDISAVASIEDEDALMRTESGASDYLAEAAMGSLADSYIEHLRNMGMERLRRQARQEQKQRIRAARQQGVPAAELRTPLWRAEAERIDESGLAELEERLDHNRRIVEHRLFGLATESIEGEDEEASNLRERARQIAKRAARTMSELAGADPRFAMMAEYNEAMARERSVH